MRPGDRGADYRTNPGGVLWLKERQLTFVCRYLLDDARNAGKALKLPEARALSAGGIEIVGNFEFATRPLGTRAQGQKDAQTALTELRALGAPRRVVYFSFDYDVQPVDLPGVLAYITGAGDVLGPGNVGAYGSYRLVEYLGGTGVKWLWQTYAWSGGRWSQHATVRQTRNGAWPGSGVDADLNISQAFDIGQWTLGGPAEQEQDDMDMNTLTPGGEPTYGVPLGEYLKVLGRGANSAAAAAAGTETLARIVRDLISQQSAEDNADDAALAEVRAALTARVDAVLTAVQTGGLDASQIAQALAEALPPVLAGQVADELAARLTH